MQQAHLLMMIRHSCSALWSELKRSKRQKDNLGIKELIPYLLGRVESTKLRGPTLGIVSNNTVRKE